MMADRDDVARLQCVFLDQLAIDISAIGAVQVLKERVIQDIDDQRVMATDGRIINPHIVVGKAPNRVALFRHVVFGQDLIVEAKD